MLFCAVTVTIQPPSYFVCCISHHVTLHFQFWLTSRKGEWVTSCWSFSPINDSLLPGLWTATIDLRLLRWYKFKELWEVLIFTRLFKQKLYEFIKSTFSFQLQITTACIVKLLFMYMTDGQFNFVRKVLGLLSQLVSLRKLGILHRKLYIVKL